jgi:hypothetical protein
MQIRGEWCDMLNVLQKVLHALERLISWFVGRKCICMLFPVVVDPSS